MTIGQIKKVSEIKKHLLQVGIPVGIARVILQLYIGCGLTEYQF